MLSRNYLNNTQYKYAGNVEADTNKLYDYLSGEGEIKSRFERTIIGDKGLRVNFGASAEYAHYRNSTYKLIYTETGENTLSYETNLKLGKFGVFGQISNSYLDERLRLSLGVRTDFNSYASSMSNPIKQLSPRFSASYILTEKLNLNFNIGRYYQLPPYTAMGYSTSTEKYVNKNNNLKYIGSDHIVAGVELIPNENIQITAEGFMKFYSRYPFSVTDSVPLSSKGADYGIFGDEELVSISDGRAYGVELLGRLKEFKKINLVFSYTYVRSEFRDLDSKWIASSWDNRHLFNITATKKFNRNWDFGFKWRFVGGAPYTPYDVEKSMLKAAWDLQGQGYLDYSNFNTQRLMSFHQLDVRVDKQYFFKGWSLMIYADVQNIYNHQADQPAILIRESDANGIPLTDPVDPLRYIPKFIDGSSGTVLPTIGIMVEF